MARINHAVFKLSLLLSLQLSTTLGWSTLLNISSPSLAGDKGGIPQRWQAKAYQPPKGFGAPIRREAGGTRGDSCTQINRENMLRALVPQDGFGVTVAASPTLLFYMPNMNPESPEKPVEFVLVDDNENEVYKSTFKTTGKSGIVSISLPPNAGASRLQLGKDYHWYLSIVCDPQERSNDIAVSGRIRRVELQANTRSQLQQTAAKDKAKLYAEAEVWFDALAALAEQRTNNPNDAGAVQEWEQLLKSVQLDAIAKESLVQSAIAPTNPLTFSDF